MRPARIRAHRIALILAATVLAAACQPDAPPEPKAGAIDRSVDDRWEDSQLDSLADLSLEALRARGYGSTLHLELNLGQSEFGPAYHDRFSGESPPYDTYVASYDSDGLRVYTRIDVPAQAPPPGGYPVLIFVHGWRGREAAPGFDFMYRPDSVSARYIDAFVDAGFLVLSPALRGHGTVNGIAADGIEFLDAWDNASYLSPLFYAIDVLNLLEGAQALAELDWHGWGRSGPITIDPGRINIAGHSQGGDAVLTALAVSGPGSTGSGSTVRNRLAAGSLWSGCFGPRLEQLAIYGPMAATLEAFMSGDGTWTGTDVGRDGQVNPNFVFGWPPDWIGTTDPESPEWTWQADTWPVPTVAEVLQNRAAEMYGAINSGVGDLGDAAFEIVTDDGGRASVRHDPRIERAMRAIDAYRHAELLEEPLHLHHSDQDYYSIPRWNDELAGRIRGHGGHASAYAYPRNTHSLLVSERPWFSPGEVVAGLPLMIERDLALFRGADPAGVDRTAGELLSIDAIRRYAANLSNEFAPKFDREPLDGVLRRVVSFRADGLQQYALVLTPAGPPPDNGWPVVLMNHGHHPNPPDYGRTADGGTDRPGDYYRGIPLAFAQGGYLVVVPDFRGHNESEGGNYTRGLLEPYWYTRDAIAAFRALDSLPGADTSNVFMWGHSMGGAVTLRALLALGAEVRAASIWSAAAAELEDKARNQVKRTGTPDDDRADLAAEIAALPFAFDPARADPGGYLDQLQVPLSIHHATADPVTPYAWSEAAQGELQRLGRPATLYSYPSENHLFAGEELSLAIERDLGFFSQRLQ